MKTETESYQFQKVTGEKIEDAVKYINDHVLHVPDAEVYLGVDSKVRKADTYYAIVIGIYTPGKGAHIIHADKYGPRLPGIKNMPERLRNEVNYAVDVGIYLSTRLSRNIMVHVDINPDPKHDSNIVHRYAVGYLTGSGLPNAVKPDAFMAMRAADFLTYAGSRY